jgi:hypothetical protein
MVAPHHAFDLIKGTDWDDKIIHYLLIGIGLTIGSFAKALWDKLAEKFWDKEFQEFKKFKESQKSDAR